MIKPTRHSTWVHTKLATAVILVVALSSFPSRAFGFHGGYHFDLTRECLIMEGFSENATQMVQVSNWYDDAYDLSGESWLKGAVAGQLFPPQGFLWEAAARLHFMHDQDYTQVSAEWDRLQKNTYAMVTRAEDRQDVLGLLVVMGASLHWLQDFYAHSNWADLDWSGDATWFDVSEIEKRARVESGEIEIYTAYEGDRSHKAINMDNASRAGERPFEKAYREAFYATCQWVNLIKSWVGPDFWSSARGYSNPSANAEATWARKMMWYVGTWKGSWRGDWSTPAEDVARIALAHEDFPAQNKWEEYAIGLARGEDVTLPVSSYSFIEAHNWLVIDHRLVEQTDCSTYEDIDPGGRADFYAKIRVDDRREYIEAFYEDADSLDPQWLTLIPFGKDITSIHFEYAIWDDDGGTSSDDHCDIAYERNIRDWVWDGSPWRLSTINAGTGSAGVVETNGLQRCDSSCFLNICDYDSIGDGDEARVEFQVRFAEQSRREVDLTIVHPAIHGPIVIPPELLWTSTPTHTLTPTIAATFTPSMTPTMRVIPTATQTASVTTEVAAAPTVDFTAIQTPTATPSPPSVCPWSLPLVIAAMAVVCAAQRLAVRRPKP